MIKINGSVFYKKDTFFDILNFLRLRGWISDEEDGSTSSNPGHNLELLADPYKNVWEISFKGSVMPGRADTLEFMDEVSFVSNLRYIDAQGEVVEFGIIENGVKTIFSLKHIQDFFNSPEKTVIELEREFFSFKGDL